MPLLGRLYVCFGDRKSEYWWRDQQEYATMAIATIQDLAIAGRRTTHTTPKSDLGHLAMYDLRLDLTKPEYFEQQRIVIQQALTLRLLFFVLHEMILK
jgi:hypothetical protein